MIFPNNSNSLPLEIRRFFDFANSTLNKIGGVSVVIPVRGLDRLPNLYYCISRLLMQNVDNLEIIVSEEDSAERIKLDKYLKDSRIKKIYTPCGSTMFNKSVAINAGVIAAKYSKILMNDADIIPPKGYIARLDNILNEFEFFFVGQVIYNVNLIRTAVTWTGSKRTDYFSGGSIGFTKSKFFEIGGMCEKFSGYGSEDCEFWTRVKELTKLYEVRDSVLLHLNHKRLTSFSINADIYESLVKQNMDERLQNLRIDLQKRMNKGVKNV